MIDYMMVRKTDCCLVKDVKMILSERCVPQHRIVVGRLVIPMKPCIREENCQVCFKVQSVEVEI